MVPVGARGCLLSPQGGLEPRVLPSCCPSRCPPVPPAGVAELVYATVSKAVAREGVRVRLPLPALPLDSEQRFV